MIYILKSKYHKRPALISQNRSLMNHIRKLSYYAILPANLIRRFPYSTSCPPFTGGRPKLSHFK